MSYEDRRPAQKCSKADHPAAGLRVALLCRETKHVETNVQTKADRLPWPLFSDQSWQGVRADGLAVAQEPPPGESVELLPRQLPH